MQTVPRREARPPEPYLDPLGEALRRLRRRAKKTGREISKITNLNEGEISGWETGSRRPGLDNLVRYLRGVEADLADLQQELDRLGDHAPLPRNGTAAASREAEYPAAPADPGLDRLFERYLARALERLLDPDRRDAEPRDRDSRAS